MANRVYEWVDERTGIKPALDYVMYRRLPKSVNWFFTLGSASLTVFIIQAVSGAFLAMGYTPSTAPVNRPDGIISNEALESIRYTTGEGLASFGYWVRGFHHWGANMMVIVVVLHMLRVFFMGSYKYPRELTWFTGVFILILVLGFSFTGYLLPWDNRAYWATQVGVRIGGSAPVLGDSIANVLRGGPTLGAQTLTRFYALHVLLLPALIAGLIGVHLFLIIKIGISGMPKGKKKDEAPTELFESSSLNGKKSGKAFFPYIIFKDAVVSALVVALVVLATIFWPVESSNPVDANNPVSTVQTQKGLTIFEVNSSKELVTQKVNDKFEPIKAANGNTTYVTRDGKEFTNLTDNDVRTVQVQPQPEWYFLFLFQFLKYLPTEVNFGLFSISGEAIGGIIIPTILIGVLFFVPYLDRGKKRNPLNRPWTSIVMLAVLAGIVALTVVAITDLNKAQSVQAAPAPAAAAPTAGSDAGGAATAAPGGTATTAAAGGATAGDSAAGLKVFQANGCGGCHLNNGKVKGIGPVLANTTRDDAYIRNNLKNGKGAMPPYPQIQGADLDNLVAYIKNLK